MNARKIILTILGLIILIGGIIAGVILIRQRQELQEEAAVPGGEGSVSIFPQEGNFDVGETFPVSVFFNTSGISISGITVKLNYPFSGTTPEITASNIQVNSAFTSSGDWNCPTRNIVTQGGNVNIEIGCANLSASGYSNNQNTLLASFDLTVNRVPLNNPTEVVFDSSNSIMTQKTTGEDILNIPSGPTSVGVYTIGGQAGTPTATPTTQPGVATSTPQPTSAVTSTPTQTPTLRATSTPTSTSSATITKGGLPDAGNSLPTVVILGFGLLILLGSLILAI